MINYTIRMDKVRAEEVTRDARIALHALLLAAALEPPRLGHNEPPFNKATLGLRGPGKQRAQWKTERKGRK